MEQLLEHATAARNVQNSSLRHSILSLVIIYELVRVVYLSEKKNAEACDRILSCASVKKQCIFSRRFREKLPTITVAFLMTSGIDEIPGKFHAPDPKQLRIRQLPLIRRPLKSSKSFRWSIR